MRYNLWIRRHHPDGQLCHYSTRDPNKFLLSLRFEFVVNESGDKSELRTGWSSFAVDLSKSIWTSGMDGARLCFWGSLKGAKPPFSIQRFIWNGNSLMSVHLLINLLPALAHAPCDTNWRSFFISMFNTLDGLSWLLWQMDFTILCDRLFNLFGRRVIW